MQVWYKVSNTFTVAAGSTVRSSANGWVQVPTTYTFACTQNAVWTLPNVNIPLPAGTKVTISLTTNGLIGYITGTTTTPTVRTILSSPLVEEFPRGGGEGGGVPGQVGNFPRVPVIDYTFQFCSSPPPVGRRM
jgi:hypothetical protein